VRRDIGILKSFRNDFVGTAQEKQKHVGVVNTIEHSAKVKGREYFGARFLFFLFLFFLKFVLEISEKRVFCEKIFCEDHFS
jgi:hypothetical protein